MNDVAVVEKKLQWYHIRQNNSGGYWETNDDVSSDVFVQAYSPKEAEAIISPILERYSNFCSCCGERWYIWLDEDDGYDEPSRWGESIYKEYWGMFHSEEEATLYWHNGLVDKFYPHTKSLTEKTGETL